MSYRWVKLDVGYFSHPKLMGLHPSARLLHLRSILWTAEHLTDGYVPPKALRQLSEDVAIASRWRKHWAEALVTKGLWDLVDPPAGGWVVHDFTDHNRTSTREYVEKEREAARVRQARHREPVTPLHLIESRRDSEHVTPPDKTRQDKT